MGHVPKARELRDTGSYNSFCAPRNPRILIAQGHMPDVRSLTTETPLRGGWGRSPPSRICAVGATITDSTTITYQKPQDNMMEHRRWNLMEPEKQSPSSPRRRGPHFRRGGSLPDPPSTAVCQVPSHRGTVKDGLTHTPARVEH